MKALTIKPIGVLLVFLATSSASYAQDPHVVVTPVDVVILTDWSIFFSSSDGAHHAGPPVQSAAQQTRNRGEMTPPPSAAATRAVKTEFVAPLRESSTELGRIAEQILSSPGLQSSYRNELTTNGFDDEHLADVVAAFTLAIYFVAHEDSTQISAASAAERRAMQSAVRDTLISYLPPTISERDLRVVLEVTQAEHMLLTQLWNRALRGSSTEKRQIKEALLKRAEDFALVNVMASKLDAHKGFIER
ncbi:MAG: hypothetical protein AB8G16_15875 [Gammaproteobacteria bacterium]